MIGSEPAKWNIADRRDDVVVDDPRVAVQDRRSHVATLDRQPRVGEELAEVNRSAPHGRSTGSVAFDAGRHLFGFVAVVAGGMPSASFVAGEGVEAVVGDDIEAVLALDDIGHHPSLTTSEPTPTSSRPALSGDVQFRRGWFRTAHGAPARVRSVDVGYYRRVDVGAASW